MKCATTYTLLTAASLACAQTFSGFDVQISSKLTVLYGNKSVNNGEQIPRANVLSPPSIGSPSTKSATGRSVLIMMDSDVPRNSTSRTTLLHWLVPDITGDTSGQNSSLLTISPNVGIPYVSPSPPVGDYPHRYSFLLYEQPRNFSIPASVNASSRIGFNLEGFLAASGLQTALAANYMLVANTSGPATTSFPPALYTASSTLASSAANISPTGSVASRSGSSSGSSSATTTASGSGTAATASASSTGEGSVMRAGSGVALLAAVFGALLM